MSSEGHENEYDSPIFICNAINDLSSPSGCDMKDKIVISKPEPADSTY